jgi:hypothetical protein
MRTLLILALACCRGPSHMDGSAAPGATSSLRHDAGTAQPAVLSTAPKLQAIGRCMQ